MRTKSETERITGPNSGPTRILRSCRVWVHAGIKSPRSYGRTWFRFRQAIRIGIKNSPVTIEDVIIAEKIFGQDVGSLRGKSTRTKPTPPVQNYIEIPPELLKAQESVTGCAG